MAVVETRGLTKVFKEGQLGAVNNVSLQTREGEFLVFLGPSGSGKTALLRMIAGLEQPTAGEILIGGAVVNHLPPRERRIAMVFQSYALYPHLTVFQNIAFPLKAPKVKKELHQQKVDWAASLLGIGKLLNRKPRELSRDERQRVALARPIVREPTASLLAALPSLRTANTGGRTGCEEFSTAQCACRRCERSAEAHSTPFPRRNRRIPRRGADPLWIPRGNAI